MLLRKVLSVKKYKLLKQGGIVETSVPGAYAGNRPHKIFGRLDCKSGMRMKKENRVFFASLEDAVKEGYRPCNRCKPVDETLFERIKQYIPYENVLTLQDFYALRS